MQRITMSILQTEKQGCRQGAGRMKPASILTGLAPAPRLAAFSAKRHTTLTPLLLPGQAISNSLNF